MQNRRRAPKSKHIEVQHPVTRHHLPHRELPVQPVVPGWHSHLWMPLFTHLYSMNTIKGELTAPQKPEVKQLVLVNIATYDTITLHLYHAQT